MEKKEVKALAKLILEYYTVSDAVKKLNELTEDERQDVLEEIAAQLGK